MLEQSVGIPQDAASITTVPNPSLWLGKHKISAVENQSSGLLV